MLADARRNLKTFSAVGITERLPESCELFRARMGWSRNIPLYAKNVNPSRPNIDHFSDDVVTAIRKHNTLDIELYDYAIDLFERALDETY
jgi:hypothetical protein